MSAHAKKHCADCGHAKALHRVEGQHPCVLDDCGCARFVSAAEGQEVAEALRAQLGCATVEDGQ